MAFSNLVRVGFRVRRHLVGRRREHERRDRIRSKAVRGKCAAVVEVNDDDDDDGDDGHADDDDIQVRCDPSGIHSGIKVMCLAWEVLSNINVAPHFYRTDRA